MNKSKVGIVVLNFNCSDYTIACVKSIVNSTYDNFICFIIDNGSSLEERSALENKLHVLFSSINCSSSSLNIQSQYHETDSFYTSKVVLIRISNNVGYAGGNNIGIQHAIDNGCDLIWILNNDTIVDSQALRFLVAYAGLNPWAGIIGCCIMDYNTQNIQCIGGARYMWLTGKSYNFLSAADCFSAEHVIKHLFTDYISGASIMVRKDVLEQIGYFDERFYLYHEEVDLAERCAKHGIKLGVSLEARIWHKGGASTGSISSLRSRSVHSVYFVERGCILLSRKHHSFVTAMLAVARVIHGISFLMVGRRDCFTWCMKGILDGLRGALGTRPDNVVARMDVQ